MPAGCLSDDYSKRLEFINWRDLYRKYQGFMLVEDMRAQWKELGYDYVLIDSRTGHTDVGGICTKQLPDTLVAMAFPNYQNLEGLASVVKSAQDDHARFDRNAPPDVKLVLSRIPDCDDENGILEKIEDSFSKKVDASGVFYVHAYDSMDLLDSSIFSISRPRSRLALEYRSLADAIRASNLEDRDGVLVRLNEFEQEQGLGIISEFSEGIDWYWVDQIEERYQDDIQILKNVGFYLLQNGEFDRAGQFLSAANILGDQDVLIPYAICNMYNGHPSEAVDFVLKAFDRSESVTNVLSGLQIIFDAGIDKSGELQGKAVFRSLDANSWNRILAKISPTNVPGYLNLRSILNQLELSISVDEIEVNDLIRQMIVARMFERAVSVYDRLDEGDKTLQTRYNYAMAKWAVDQTPPLKLFEEISLEYNPTSHETANYHQCFALVFGVLGDRESALEAITAAEHRVRRARGFRMLSTWNFLYVPREIAEQHFDQFKAQLKVGEIIPSIVSGAM